MKIYQWIYSKFQDPNGDFIPMPMIQHDTQYAANKNTLQI